MPPPLTAAGASLINQHLYGACNWMEFLYHGSVVAGITTLETRSLLHNSDKKVVYLTGNLPFALVYIWDGQHNHYDKKYVSGGIRNGTAFYEEWFPNQLEMFYKNVSGYLYCVQNCVDFQSIIELLIGEELLPGYLFLLHKLM